SFRYRGIMEYGAITVDTSIFDQKGLLLESGLLNALVQFNNKPAKLVLSEIVIREVNAHLIKKVNDSYAQLDKSLNNAKKHIFGNVQDISIDRIDGEVVAKERLESYVNNTGAVLISASNGVDLNHLIKLYFNNEPPFAEAGKKKSEFPDAIALLSLEAWAIENKTRILAVTTDKDWANFAENSDHIDVLEDLAQAISKFEPNEKTFDFTKRLSLAMSSGEAQDIVELITDRVADAVSEQYLYAEAESAFYWDSHDFQAEFSDIEFITDDEGAILLNPIQSQDNHVVFEVKANIAATAMSSFTLSVHDSIDGDSVKLGEVFSESDLNFETGILFTINGSWDGELSALDVDDVEVLSFPKSVDFGYLEPDV
ncbi:PIN domain-containing protein, partial [Vibrio vulnificus]